MDIGESVPVGEFVTKAAYVDGGSRFQFTLAGIWIYQPLSYYLTRFEMDLNILFPAC